VTIPGPHRAAHPIPGPPAQRPRRQQRPPSSSGRAAQRTSLPRALRLPLQALQPALPRRRAPHGTPHAHAARAAPRPHVLKQMAPARHLGAGARRRSSRAPRPPPEPRRPARPQRAPRARRAARRRARRAARRGARSLLRTAFCLLPTRHARRRMRCPLNPRGARRSHCCTHCPFCTRSARRAYARAPRRALTAARTAPSARAACRPPRRCSRTPRRCAPWRTAAARAAPPPCP